MGRDANFNNGLPIGQPALRSWELNENSTRYDKVLAAPSDGDLKIMWIAYSSVLFVFSVYMVTIFLALITNKKIRTNSYNLYLIYLMIPDIIFNLFCAVTCAWLAANDGFQHAWICNFQSVYLVFGVCANSWINGIIAYEVFKMLHISNAGQRYHPPSLRMVTRNALLVYAGAIFLSLWGVVSFPWLPHETNLQNGMYCIPLEYNRASVIFFWLAYFPFFCAIPLFFCVWATAYAIWYKLLPPSGKRRVLTIYFFRIVAVFVIMWGPLLVVAYAAGGAGGHPWAVWAVALWGHVQGAVSASVSLLKEDIRFAVIKFVTCGKVVKKSRNGRNRRGTVQVYGESEETVSAFWSYAQSFKWRISSRRLSSQALSVHGLEDEFSQIRQQSDLEVSSRRFSRQALSAPHLSLDDNSQEHQETDIENSSRRLSGHALSVPRLGLDDYSQGERESEDEPEERESNQILEERSSMDHIIEERSINSSKPVSPEENDLSDEEQIGDTNK